MLSRKGLGLIEAVCSTPGEPEASATGAQNGGGTLLWALTLPARWIHDEQLRAQQPTTRRAAISVLAPPAPGVDAAGNFQRPVLAGLGVVHQQRQVAFGAVLLDRWFRARGRL